MVSGIVLSGALVGAVLGTPATTLAADPTEAALGQEWAAWTSAPSEPGARLLEVPPSALTPTRVLDVSPGSTHQEWMGVGAALTDASLGLLRANTGATALLFDPARADGAHLNLVRLPLTSTDFSTTQWTFGWNDASRTLTAPMIATDSATFITDELVARRPDLSVVAVPWTAPTTMKSPATLNGGSLQSSSVPAYARMLVAEADWLRARGVPLTAMSLGNEPFHSTWSYPTMLMSDQQMIDLAQNVAPALRSRGVGLWAVDHNWEHRSHYDTVLGGAPDSFSAAAFHCYGGQPSQMADLAAPPIMTECTGTNDGFEGTFRWDAANLVVNAIKAGSTGLLMWNLALNEQHGPHTGGCSTCRGVVDIDSATGAISRGPEFFTLAHLARAADPGALVIGTGTSSGLPYVAFLEPDGRIGVIGHNDTGAPQQVGVTTDGRDPSASFPVPAGALFTIRGWSDFAPPTLTLSTVDPEVGSEVTVTATGWDPQPARVKYQWLADGTPIDGATWRSLAVTQDLVGARLSTRVTGSRPGYEPVAAVSGETGPVRETGTAIENDVAPELSGYVRVGRRTSVSTGSWTPSDVTLTYQWSVAGNEVGGANSSDFTPRAEDLGDKLKVAVTASRPGLESLTLDVSATHAVEPGRIRVVDPGRIAGRTQVGRRLRVGGIQTAPATSVAYQWRRSGHPLRADGAYYRLRPLDRGHVMSVEVVLRRDGYLDRRLIVVRRQQIR